MDAVINSQRHPKPEMNFIPNPTERVREFARKVESAVYLPLPNLLDQLGSLLREGVPLIDELTDLQREGSPEKYTRNVLYADPLGRFTVMALIWRQGQFTPVHGHWTWCGYSVLCGEMEEENFAWNSGARIARPKDRVTRSLHCAVVSPPGLDDIHRLGNVASRTAISLHVYGVDSLSVATRINRVVGSQS